MSNLYQRGTNPARDAIVDQAIARMSTGHCTLSEAQERNAAGWPDQRRWGTVADTLTAGELRYAWNKGQDRFYGRS